MLAGAFLLIALSLLYNFSYAVNAFRLLASSSVASMEDSIADGAAPISLGDLNENGGNIYFRAAMNFTARHGVPYPNLMQSDDINDGVRVELSGRDLVVIANQGKENIRGIRLGSIDLGKEHRFELEALQEGYVRTRLDDGPWQTVKTGSLQIPSRNFRIGDGHIKDRRWQGDIKHVELVVRSAPNWMVGAYAIAALIVALLGGAAFSLKHSGIDVKDMFRNAALRLSIIARALRQSSPPLPAPVGLLALLVAGVTAFYTASYSFGYFPITEGWFTLYVDSLKHGLYPYRDLNLLLTPVSVLWFYLFDAIFGNSFVALRILGVIISASIAYVWFQMLRRVFDPWISAFAATASAIFYQSGVAYIGYDFTQIVTLLMLVGCYGLVLYVSSWRPSHLFVSGVALSLATLTKQSNGGIVSVGMTVMVVVTLYFLRRKYFYRHLSCFILGALIPLILVLAWLVHIGVLTAFVEQTVLHAVSAKGGPKAIAFGWVYRLFTESAFAASVGSTAFLFARTLVAALCLMSLASIIYALFTASGKIATGSGNPTRALPQQFADDLAQHIFSAGGRRHTSPIASLAGVGLIAALIAAYRFGLPNPLIITGDLLTPLNLAGEFWALTLKLIDLAVLTCLIGIIIAALRLRKGYSSEMLTLLLICAFGVILMAANGSSAGVGEISCFLGVAILVAAAMSAVSRSALLSFIIIVMCANSVNVFVGKKFAQPYNWWGLHTEAVRSSDCATLEERLAGLCLSKTKAAAIHDIVDAVKLSSSPGGSVLSFPNAPIFIVLADRKPYGRSPIPWFDFMSQKDGRELLAQLHQKLPDAIVMTRMAEAAFDEHEKAFNGGSEGVHREISDYVDELWSEHRIELVAERFIDGVYVQVFRPNGR